MAERKLQMLNRAIRIDDLCIPLIARLEKLSGDRAGQWSIRINDQWRVCFEWLDGALWRVEIADYHRTMTDFISGMRPIHPGEVLREEFLIPFGLSAHAPAIALQVPAPRINDIVRERRAVTPDTALRLSAFFGVSAILDGAANGLRHGEGACRFARYAGAYPHV